MEVQLLENPPTVMVINLGMKIVQLYVMFQETSSLPHDKTGNVVFGDDQFRLGRSDCGHQLYPRELVCSVNFR